MANLSSLNISYEFFRDLNNSYSLLDQTRKIGLCASLVIVLLGIIGHFLTAFVFSQSRFRKNPSAVFLLCLSVIDALILVLYFLEESILPIQFYLTGYVTTAHLTSNVCILLNFFRYSFRCISAFLIVLFTTHRVFVVYSPLNVNLRNNWAWKLFALIIVVSFLMNTWTSFIFTSVHENSMKSCQVKNNLSILFDYITIINICVSVFLPIAIIIVANSLIILKITDSLPSNDSHFTFNTQTTSANSSFRKRLSAKRKNIQKRSELDAYLKIKPYYMNTLQLVNRMTPVNSREANSKKLTLTLIITSFSYALLNLPYCIISFYLSYANINDSFRQFDPITKNHIYLGLNVSKIFYLLNYGIRFYIYSITGSLFVNQLKYSGIF
jgi:hypothetical protein